MTYANVTATLALFVALSGGAYAAAKLPANSVGPVQLQDDAVSSPKVLDASLQAEDFAPGQLPGGVRGLEVVYAASGSGAAASKDAEARCPSGKKVTGGGALVAGASKASVTSSTPGSVPNPTSWYVQAREFVPSSVDWTLYAYAVCAITSP
jgi:hypothetical protein